jgi:hypothetical protein
MGEARRVAEIRIAKIVENLGSSIEKTEARIRELEQEIAGYDEEDIDYHPSEDELPKLQEALAKMVTMSQLQGRTLKAFMKKEKYI